VLNQLTDDVLERRTASGSPVAAPAVNEHLGRAAVGITIAIGVVALALAYLEHRSWFRALALAAAGRVLILLRRVPGAGERRRDLAQPGRAAGRLAAPAAAAAVGVGQAQPAWLGPPGPGVPDLHPRRVQRHLPATRTVSRRPRILVLGAGFGGLELSATLSSALGPDADIIVMDQAGGFVFGFSKLDVMFGKRRPAQVFHPYKDIGKPGLRFVRTTIGAIDPQAKRVDTDAGSFHGDIIVVALGADLDDGHAQIVMEMGNHVFCHDIFSRALTSSPAGFRRGP